MLSPAPCGVILPPSKKIFIGSSAALTGLALQFVLSALYSYSLASLQSGNAAPTPDLDRKLESLHQQMELGFNGLTASWLLLLGGIVTLLTGIYQNAKLTEHLLERVRILDESSSRQT